MGASEGLNIYQQWDKYHIGITCEGKIYNSQEIKDEITNYLLNIKKFDIELEERPYGFDVSTTNYEEAFK